MEQGRAERPVASAASGAAAVPDGTHNGAAGAAGRRIARALAAFAIALALMTPGMRAPFDKDAETQSAQWIVDIVKHGNWLLPLDYYGYVERKPPMFYWLGSIWPWLRGGPITQTEARLPSLVAGAGVAALATDWAAADFGAVGGWLAFLFLIGSYGFAVRANVALTDMVMTLLLLSAWRAMRGPLKGASGRAGPLAAGVFLGLGVLTKGPVVVVLAGLAALIYIVLGRGNPFRFARRGWPYGMLAIALALGAAWYIPAFIVGRSQDWGGVFFDENFGHFMPAAIGGTGEAARPVYYIVARLFGAMMPLSLFAAPLLIAAFGGGFGESRRGAVRYHAALAMAVVGLFSLGSAKRDDYILPAIPPLAMLYAGLFAGALRRGTIAVRVRDAIAWAIAIAVPLAMIGLVAMMRAGVHLAPLDASLESSDASYANIFLSGIMALQLPFAIFIVTTFAGGLIAIYGLRRRASAVAGAGIGLISLAGGILFAGVVRPIEAGTRCLGPFVNRIEARVGGDPLYVAFNDEELAWYNGGAIPHLPRELARIGPAEGHPTYLVARPTELVLLAPPVRRALAVVMHSGALGGNQPTLYLMRAPVAMPADASAGLKADTGSVK
jgi:4-amino-4-deoxy-L-arabinose transferase-like glycosyltransferase